MVIIFIGCDVGIPHHLGSYGLIRGHLILRPLSQTYTVISLSLLLFSQSLKFVKMPDPTFPAPMSTAPLLTRSEALDLLSSPDLLIVDVRRTDYEGGTIRGSLNLPAQSFYMNRGVLYDLCKRAGVKKVTFYCGTYDFNPITD